MIKQYGFDALFFRYVYKVEN